MIDTLTTYVTLTDDELVLLDGRCRPEIQAKVDQARDRLNISGAVESLEDKRLVFIAADLIAQAVRNGVITSRSDTLKGSFSTDCCNTRPGHHVYTRNTSQHRKGDINLDHPKSMSVTRIGGHAMCSTCLNLIAPALRAQLADVIAQWPPIINKTDLKHEQMLQCSNCSWRGTRLQLVRAGKTSELTCPDCQIIERSKLFNSNYEQIFCPHGFVIMNANGEIIRDSDEDDPERIKATLHHATSSELLELIANSSGQSAASIMLGDT